ncbi:MAG: hypothetical protein WBA16_07340 [Nonlabens sp.]
MRKLLFLLCCVCSIFTPAQDGDSCDNLILEDAAAFRSRFLNYKIDYTNQLKKYEPNKDGNYSRIIDDRFFTDELNKVFSTVVVGSSSLSTNGSSFAFTQAEDKTTLSLNAIIWNNKARKNYFTAGLNAVKSDGSYNIFSNDSWNDKFGLNLGYIRVLSKSMFFSKKEAKNLVIKRQAYAMRKMDSLYFLGIRQSAALKAILKSLPNESIEQYFSQSTIDPNSLRFKKSVELLAKEKTYHLKLAEMANLIKNKSTPDLILAKKKEIDKLKKEIKTSTDYVPDYIRWRDSIQTLRKNICSTKKLLESYQDSSYIEKELADFHKKNTAVKHYSLRWFATSLNLANAEYSFKDSLLTANNFKAIDRRTVYDFSASIHQTSHNLKVTHYLELKANLRIGSYLDNPSLELEDPVIATTAVMPAFTDVLVQDKDGNTVGGYGDLDRSSSYLDLSVYGVIFPTDKRNAGISARFNYSNVIRQPSSVNFEDNISFALGFLLRNVEEEVFSKGVFGIETGFENMPEGKKIKDFFSARLTLGIPFAVFKKKKS